MTTVKTVIEVSDGAEMHVGVNAEGRMYVRIGGEHEQQVEIVCSSYDTIRMASEIMDRTAGYVSELERQLARWVNTG